MKIQSISAAQNSKIDFGQSSNRRFEDMSVLKQQSINATLYDLYQMEDRIISNQERLIKNQNDMIGKTLQSISALIYEGSPDDYEQATDNASLLKLNVNA